MSMGKQGTHTKIINRLAKQKLAPLGIIQKGRSRTWLDDNQWWLTVIEFQPSSGGKGTYLNVGVNWLWHVKDYLSFDYGYREHDFVEYKDDEQFTEAAEKIVGVAMHQVGHYRKKFATIEKAARILNRRRKRDFWSSFNAAIASGIVGDKKRATKSFEKVLAFPKEYNWIVEAQNSAQALLALVDKPDVFRKRTEEEIRKMRSLLGLPDIQNIQW